MLLRILNRKAGMMLKWTLVAACLLALSSPALAQSGSRQVSERLAQNPCSSKQTCHECIQTSTCAWCSQPEFGDRKRCFQPNVVDSNRQCDEAHTINPHNEHKMVRNDQLSAASKGSGAYSESGYESSSHQESHRGFEGGFQEAVQVAPQHVNLKLRINEKYRLTLQYGQAEDYPLDLYYLMDLSKSMEDDKEKLSKLGNDLAGTMKRITSNFRLGFGSFVDKTVMPYVSTVPKNLREPCTGCAAPYGFHNVMPLNTDTSRFAEEVSKAAVSGNLDGPEGGFDAIMQAVVCRNNIGWRERARRLIVFSTDAGFHYAGDGKLGGIVKPNDGQCHMDDGMYTHSTLQDYPSIAQINQKVKENAINVIFAVTAEQISVYDRLRVLVEGASAGTLSNDSANVVELVKDQYDKITSSVELKDNATSAVKVTYYSSCLEDGPMKPTNKCDRLKVGTIVKFAADIEVTNCPANRNEWKQTFQIYPVGVNESLIIDLEMICDCDCETRGSTQYQENAQECNGHGTYKCGVCECDAFHFGRKCECDSENTHSDRDLTAGCRPDNTTTVDCSGRGTCVCGQCECESRPNSEEKINGQFCECDNFSCDRQGGQLCSGEEHGKCECGKCHCLPGWTGLACDCKATNETCIPPGGGEICSGKGECECGACKCFEGEDGRYSGRYCDKCPTCPGRCMEFRDCVQCQVYRTGKLSEEECASNCTFVPRVIDVVEADEEKDENLCAYYDEDDCRFAYVYSYDETGKVEIRAQEQRECPAQVYIPGIVLGVIGAIVLIGLAMLLLWKLLTTIHDRREFAKFEKERSMARWNAGENPIYKQATSTFKNPTYAGK